MKIQHEPQDKDAWVCVCGNTPPDSGFYPCDEHGHEVEPDSSWNGELYVCHQCDSIINQHNLEIVGQA